jgi:hypothetical protein
VVDDFLRSDRSGFADLKQHQGKKATEVEKFNIEAPGLSAWARLAEG